MSASRGRYEEFHPYGSTAWWFQSTTVSLKRYRYTGMERDEETGLQCHGVRYYAPWLGRWTSADPIGLGDGVNRFGYCHGNPVGTRDISGLGGPDDFDELIEEEESRLIAASTNPVPLNLEVTAVRAAPTEGTTQYQEWKEGSDWIQGQLVYAGAPPTSAQVQSDYLRLVGERGDWIVTSNPEPLSEEDKSILIEYVNSARDRSRDAWTEDEMEVVTARRDYASYRLGGGAEEFSVWQSSQAGVSDLTYGQAIAQDADQHAWEHAQEGDFGRIGDVDELADYLDSVIGGRGTEKAELAGGRIAWLGVDGTIVIFNPEQPSTAFNPDTQGVGQTSQEYWENVILPDRIAPK